MTQRDGSVATRYYQVAFACDGELSAATAKRIADFINGELQEGSRPAVIVAQINPLAAAPLDFPMAERPR